MEQKKPIDRKAQILEAAAQSFAMYGYKATTMELVSKIAAVGKGTIYTFFPTKEDLFNEIISQLTVELLKVAERTVDPKRSFFENFADVLYELLLFRERHELIVKLSQEVRDLGTPMAKDGMAKMEQAIIPFIQQHVEIGMEKGELRQSDPLLTAFVMMRLYLVLAADWSKDHEPLTKEVLTSYFTGLMKNGLGAE